MSKNKPQKGFTLIELLVVVAIISLLSSVVLGALNDARAKARDRALIQQVTQIQNALELYKDKYGEYPDASPGNPTQNNYFSRLNSNGTWSGSTVLYTNSIADRISDFLPEMTPPKKDYIAYYNNHVGTRPISWCSDQGGAGVILSNNTPPYTIWVSFETSFKDNFPNPVYSTDTTVSRVTQSCFSLK